MSTEDERFWDDLAMPYSQEGEEEIDRIIEEEIGTKPRRQERIDNPNKKIAQGRLALYRIC